MEVVYLVFNETVKLFLQSCGAILSAYQQCMNDSVFPYPYQHFVFSLFFTLVLRQCVVLSHLGFTYISLKNNDT